MMSKGSGPLDVLPCMACQQVKLLLHLLYGHLIYLFTEIVFFLPLPLPLPFPDQCSIYSCIYYFCFSLGFGI